jgi:hypothetical protein
VNIVDRRSLHLDYTRAIEKTPTPINSECTRPQAPLDSIRASARDAHRAQCPCANHPPRATKTTDNAKTLMESAFSRTVKICNVIHARQKSLRHPQLASSANRGAVAFPLDPKIFSTGRVSEALRGP